MALSALIAVIVLADLLLLAGVAWTMSLARRLDPHSPVQTSSLKLVETRHAASTGALEQERRQAA